MKIAGSTHLPTTQDIERMVAKAKPLAADGSRRGDLAGRRSHGDSLAHQAEKAMHQQS